MLEDFNWGMFDFSTKMNGINDLLQVLQYCTGIGERELSFAVVLSGSTAKQQTWTAPSFCSFPDVIAKYRWTYTDAHGCIVTNKGKIWIDTYKEEDDVVEIDNKTVKQMITKGELFSAHLVLYLCS